MDQSREGKTPEQAMQNIPNRVPSNHIGTQPQQHQTNYADQDLGDGEFLIVYAIFGGGKPGYVPSKRKAYEIDKYKDPEVMQINLIEAAKSYPNNDPIMITFTEDEAKRLSQPHSNANMVVELEIAKHKVMRKLIDGGSSADMLFTRAFSQLKLPDRTLNRLKILFAVLPAMKLCP